MIQHLAEGLERLGIWCLSQALHLRRVHMKSRDLRYLHRDLDRCCRLENALSAFDGDSSPVLRVGSDQKGEA